MNTYEIFLAVMSVVTPLITVASFCFVVKNNKRTDIKDIETRVEAMTEIRVKLDSVLKGMDELKQEIKTNKETVADLSERLKAVEESAKQAHKRIDEMKSKD